MAIAEIHSTSILSASPRNDCVVNPYTGRQHACNYCDARFMKRFGKHKEPWGNLPTVKPTPSMLCGKRSE
jgi:DNA repair photolyase